jgi:PAS domain S-box-containing protein
VEGDAARRQRLGQALEAEGYAVSEVHSSAELFARGLGDVDAVLLALRLPDGDGLAAVRALKRDPAGAAIPVLLLSSGWTSAGSTAGDERDRIQGLDSGADAFLAEPFPIDALNAQVRALLRTRATYLERLGLHARAREAPVESGAGAGLLAEQLRLSLDAVHGCAWALDLATGELRFTVAPERFVAAAAEPAASNDSTLESWLARIHPDDRRRAEARLARALHRTGSYQSEHRVRRADGAWRWVRDRGAVVPDASGAPASLVGVTLDRTQRVAAGDRAERLRRESEDRLRVALTSASLGAYDCDPRTRRLWLDERARRILGMSPEAPAELAALLARVHPDDQERIREALTALHPPPSRAEGVTEFRLVPEPDGKPRWVRASWRALLEGARASRYVGTLEDVTRPRRAKVAAAFLERVGKALISSRAYDETLSRIVELAVPILGDWAAIDVVEHGALRRVALWHRDPDKLRRGLAAFNQLPVPLATSQGLGAVVRTGEPRLVSPLSPELLEALDLNAEHRAFLEELGLCSVLGVPLSFQGRTLGVLSFSFAESGRHHGQEELELAVAMAERAAVALDNAQMFELATQERQRAEEANRAKDEFLAVVSHELRTPLTAILGYCGMMRLGKLSEARRAHAFEVIDRNARAQAQLVEDLLDISRIVSGKLRLEVRETDPREVLRAALEAVRPAALAKGIRLEVDAEPVGEIQADPDRLQQVAWNLLSNAIKFTPAEGRVTARLRREGSGISLQVEDTGQGIPGEFLPYVFDRFRQGDASSKRAHGGLGLGLAISRHLMELHGGTMDAHSDGTGKGATFTARLPVRALVAERKLPTAALPVRGPSRNLEGLRVLVVDDELDTREMIGALLMDESATVLLAGSVVEAVRLLEREPVDLLISDLAMPGEDGYALIARLRSLPRGSEVPAIALTGHARAEVRAEVMRAGFDLHLPKPVDPEELLRVVSRLVRAEP